MAGVGGEGGAPLPSSPPVQDQRASPASDKNKKGGPANESAQDGQQEEEWLGEDEALFDSYGAKVEEPLGVVLAQVGLDNRKDASHFGRHRRESKGRRMFSA